MKGIIGAIAVLFILAGFLWAYNEYPHVMDNGGGIVSDGSYNNLASIGQAVIDEAGGALYRNQAGYITAVAGLMVGIEEDKDASIPKSFSLSQNYPNPFNPSTAIRFDLPKNSEVHFAIYNVVGEKVYELNEKKHAGSYIVNFDSGELPSGVYFYTLRAGNFHSTRKMLLLK